MFCVMAYRNRDFSVTILLANCIIDVLYYFLYGRSLHSSFLALRVLLF